MIPKQRGWSNFSISEWHRLDNLAGTYDTQLRHAYLQTVVQRNQKPDPSKIRQVISDCIAETAATTSRIYGLVYNPQSTIYNRLTEELTDGYMKVIDNDEAKTKVRDILPSGLSLVDRRNRLDVFGLDARSAVHIERMRQEGASGQDIQNARLHMSVQRGNLLSATEINRVVNQAVEALCIDNMMISKADDEVYYFDSSIPSNITSIAQLPARARKEILTRRDDRVCNYCFPLDGLTASIGADFETEYGYFNTPPFHPRCRCFMVITLN